MFGLVTIANEAGTCSFCRRPSNVVTFATAQRSTICGQCFSEARRFFKLPSRPDQLEELRIRIRTKPFDPDALRYCRLVTISESGGNHVTALLEASRSLGHGGLLRDEEAILRAVRSLGALDSEAEDRLVALSAIFVGVSGLSHPKAAGPNLWPMIDGAIGRLTGLLEKHSWADGWVRLGELQYLRGRGDDGKTSWLRAAGLRNRNVATELVAQALDYWRAGDPEEARQCFLRAAQLELGRGSVAEVNRSLGLLVELVGEHNLRWSEALFLGEMYGDWLFQLEQRAIGLFQQVLASRDVDQKIFSPLRAYVHSPSLRKLDKIRVATGLRRLEGTRERCLSCGKVEGPLYSKPGGILSRVFAGRCATICGTCVSQYDEALWTGRDWSRADSN
jgi:hypothetical protein